MCTFRMYYKNIATIPTIPCMEITVREGVSTLEHWIQLDFFSRRHRDILQLYCRDRISEQNFFFSFPNLSSVCLNLTISTALSQDFTISQWKLKKCKVSTYQKCRLPTFILPVGLQILNILWMCYSLITISTSKLFVRKHNLRDT